MPISIIKAFRVPISVALVGVGVYWYVCYKFEEVKKWALGRLNNVMLDLGLKAIASRVSEVKLPEIPETWPDDVKVTANNILKSATNGLNDIGSRIQEIKLPDISKTDAGKFIEGLFGGRKHKGDDGKSEGSEGERQSNKKPPTDEAVVATLEADKPLGRLKVVEGIANNILKSATNGLNDIGSRIQEVKLPDISETDAGKFVNNLLGGQQHKEGNGKGEGSKGERQSDKKAPTDTESEIIDKKDRPSSAR